jgi:XTP/dITP diphosphohydrolase
MQLIYGSTNHDKLTEVVRLGDQFGLTITDLRKAAEVTGKGMPPGIAEPEVSYEGNAALKARGYSDWFDRPCVVDDSGLEVDALGGLPGVYTAMFGFERVSSMLIPGVPYTARFICCVAYAEPSGRLVSVTAALSGRICFPAGAQAPSSGVPYSYFFTPDGRAESLATLVQNDSSFVSHRGRAFIQLMRSLTLLEVDRG